MARRSVPQAIGLRLIHKRVGWACLDVPYNCEPIVELFRGHFDHEINQPTYESSFLKAAITWSACARGRTCSQARCSFGELVGVGVGIEEGDTASLRALRLRVHQIDVLRGGQSKHARHYTCLKTCSPHLLGVEASQFFVNSLASRQALAAVRYTLVLQPFPYT